jgi:hypothetical protein
LLVNYVRFIRFSLGIGASVRKDISVKGHLESIKPNRVLLLANYAVNLTLRRVIKPSLRCFRERLVV